MDFAETDEQRELAGLSRRILAREATPQRLADLEACGAPVPYLASIVLGAGALARFG